jgi:general secretion pathway protein E
MTRDESSQFVEHLRQGGHLTRPVEREDASTADSDLQQKRLWEFTDLSTAEFADIAARFYHLERISLQDMLAAAPLAGAFSRRFLREMLVFPLQSADAVVLAVADPADRAAQRAAEIVLGPNIAFRVASAEDLAIVLNQRLGGDEDGAHDAGGPNQPREDDIESLRDLASGAPVVRAVNDLLEKAVELRASDIHIEPFQTGLVVRLRIDGLLRPIAAPSGVLPRAVISRIKIVASLNIAERRLPQDGAARLRVGRTDIDIRVAIMPTQHGESAVIRIRQRIAGCW